jgi:spermidine synthase
MYYHFVFISISLAMLGFGCSGVSVFLFPRFFSREKCTSHLTLSSALFSLTLVLAIVIYLRVDSRFEASLSTFLVLLKIFFFIFLPYFFSGLTITLALKHYSKNITTLYCYDLVGAGLGCSVIIGMLYIYDGISLVLLTSCIAAVASLLFARSSSIKTLQTVSTIIALSALCAFACNAYGYRFLKIKYVQGKPQNEIIFEQWNPINRVTVSPSKVVNHPALLINYDSTDRSTMIAFDGDREKARFLNEYIKSFYYQIRKDADVLIIGVGGGQDVLNAYINGHRSITAIEINPAIALLNQETFRDFNGNLFHQPGIQLIVDDGRNFIRHTPKKFDIIHLGNVTSGVASASGAFTFVENSLFTVEAFKDYYNHLDDDGVLWFSRWRLGQKEQFFGIFRILTGITKALEELGVKNPEKCIIIIEEAYLAQWRQAVIFTKKTPFLLEEINRIEKLRKKMNLVWLYHPMQRINNTLNDFMSTVTYYIVYG